MSETEVVPTEVQQMAMETKPTQEARQLTLQEKFYNFLHRKDAKEERAQVETLSQELFDRVDRDKLLDDSELLYSADQYRELLTIRNGVETGKHNKQGYLENESVRLSLERIKRRWEENGLLREPEADSKAKPATETPLTAEQLADKRRGLRLSIQQAYNTRNLKDYPLYQFRAGDSIRSLPQEVDYMRSALNLESNERTVDSSRLGYDPAEYDSAFLDAMAKRAQGLFDQHREAAKQRVKDAYKDDTLFGERMGDEQFEFITDKIAPRVTITTPAPVEASVA